LLGDSLLALRVVPALFESIAVLVTASLARELGGGRFAQVIAALGMAVMPMALAIGLPFSMNPIEHLLWPLAALTLARLQNGADPKWWLALGLLLGVALENKLSTLWLGVGLAVGLLVSPARAWLRTRWPWLAAGLAVAILVPHLAWQVANDWPTLEFIRNNATAREGMDAAAVMRSPWAFALSQIAVIGPVAAPLWILGLAHLLHAPALREHRLLGWTFAVAFALVALSGRASIYYLVGVYPIVIAAGGAAFEQLARNRGWRLRATACAALVFQGLVLLPFLLPVVDADRYIALAQGARRLMGAAPESASLPPIYEWMLGGPELTEAVASVAGTLSPSEHRRAGVLATTFGEAGALLHFERQADLPPVIGTHNNFWLWGTRGVDGSVMIVVADRESPLLQSFASCRLAAQMRCPLCEPQLRGRGVFLCRRPARPLPELWLGLKHFA
jgi:energy-coupling factor transporter transmembrane protein EcfT